MLKINGLRWDLIKMEIRSSTICFSKNKSIETRDNIKEAIIESELLEKEISKKPTEETVKNTMKTKPSLKITTMKKLTGLS
jgi:hypothetical protein